MTATNDSAVTETHAYLFGWDGKGWHDMVRLSSNQVTTIGRAPTNKIVLRDEVCSRDHCEIFEVRGEWLLRDLGSRNGTKINNEQVEGDTRIESGSVITIGDCRLALTLDPEVLPDPPSVGGDVADTTASGEPAILSRQDSVKLKSAGGTELAKLFRLGLQLGAARKRNDLAEVVLTALANETVADIAAILLVKEGKELEPTSSDVNVVAYHAQDDTQPYHRLSSNLSDIVVKDREALLATDVSDTEYAVFDSLGEMKAMSVICAPIHCGNRLHGLVHLYSMNPDNPLDENELNFTVAVADQPPRRSIN